MPARDRRSIGWFVAVAYAWTWLLWVPALLYSARTGIELPRIEQGLAAWTAASSTTVAFAAAFQLAVYGPLIAAITVLLMPGNHERRKRWTSALVHIRVAPSWWAFVIGWPIGLVALVGAAGSLMGGGAPRFDALPNVGALLAMIAAQLLTSGLEEPGWRGFALPMLQETHDAENAGWYLGLIWAVWHVPYVVYLNRSAPGWSLPLTLAGFGMSIVAMGYVHSWVFNSTGSLPLNITLHAWANVANTLLAVVVVSPAVPLLTAGLTWALVAWLLRRYGKEHLSAAPSIGATGS